MDRRDFLKAAAAAGIGLGIANGAHPAAWLAGPLGSAVLGAEPDAPPDIVAVRNGEPEAMFDQGIAAMGGMSRFVKKGQKVAVKPNVSWSTGVEMAANTHPGLVNRIIRHCLEAGAAKVHVVDHTIEHWKSCYDQSGIGAAARDAGAAIAPAEAERYYAKRQINGKVLKDAQIHEAILEADVLISVPILKHHGGGGITAGIKNLMGAVWDRRFYHGNGLQQCIADFLAFRKPDLTVLDAYRILAGNGPRSRHPGDVQIKKMQVISTDVVAADAAGARLMERDPASFGHIRIAAEMGFGEIDPTRLSLRRIAL